MNLKCWFGFHKWSQEPGIIYYPLAKQWWFCVRCNKKWYYFENSPMRTAVRDG